LLIPFGWVTAQVSGFKATSAQTQLELEKKFKEWGMGYKDRNLSSVVSTPIVRALEMTGQVYFKAGLKQPAGRN